jgi:argininosuccinate lyase
MELNRELLLERAGAGYSTVTELADALVRERGLSFRTAQAVVTAVVKLAESEGVGAGGILPGLVDRAAEDVLGEPLNLSEEQISRALDPIGFVEIWTLPGGPAPEEVRRALQDRLGAHARAVRAHRERAQKVRKRLQELDTTTEGWGKRA